MEKSSIIGIILAVIAVGVGMVLKGASLSALANPAAFLIIFVGTAATLFIGFQMPEIKKFPFLLKKIFVGQKLQDKKELVQMFIEWTNISRREGLLALESKIETIDDPFLKYGMRMIIDGNDPDFVKEVLLEDIGAMEERHRSGASLFSQAGTYAPTLGVLGAVVGLVAALGNLNEIEKLGHSIAAAFIATLLGIFSGYVLWHPMANKLKQMSKKETEIRLMIAEGILSIQSGVSSIAIEQKLSIFIPLSQRFSEEKQDGEEKAGE
ncbi:flagellar motor stator protein MotA [Paenibacillus contaminans]|uniref:Flagellar motor protein MotA n=1 Tax=Paenibacillus contaminans TaxID=450362 RepID=A0A329M6Z1_9BACL|nr:flagellar motor stator protein MotA [Paenibacillus contaminans]RAV14433.1 flagellar motor protein MotA [Paenibacillus contaminans]